MDAAARRLIALDAKGGRLSLTDCGGGKVVEALEAQGWVRREKDGRKTVVAITDDGRRRARELAAEAEREAEQAPPPRARRAPAGAKLDPALDERLARIEAGVQEILTRMRRADGPAPGTPTGVPDLATVKAWALATIADLDHLHRYGGLVPIPEVRRAARARDLPDALVTDALEALEQDYAIDLNVAQSPTAVPDRHEGIERAGRGLLYYVARRGV